MLVPFVVALIYGEGDAPAFIKSASITAIVGGILFYIFRNSRNDVGKRESYLLVTSIWLFFSAFGMLPFCLMPNHLSITDAIFETVSGLTTTGASIIENVDVLPHGILFWRSFMHFIGGMGIILLTIAILPMLNHQGGLLLFNSEVTGITTEKLKPKIGETAKKLWSVYIILTIILCLLLWSHESFRCYLSSILRHGNRWIFDQTSRYKFLELLLHRICHDYIHIYCRYKFCFGV